MYIKISATYDLVIDFHMLSYVCVFSFQVEDEFSQSKYFYNVLI